MEQHLHFVNNEIKQAVYETEIFEQILDESSYLFNPALTLLHVPDSIWEKL